MSDQASSTPPAAAVWLGAAGAAPFVFLAGLAVTSVGVAGLRATFVLAAYGAVILSFLGGVQWGLAIADRRPGALARSLTQRLGVSVAPALVGWAALLLGPAATLPALAVAFTLWLLVDLDTVRRGEAPAWYPRLRWPLTIVVVVSLAAAAVGSV